MRSSRSRSREIARPKELAVLMWTCLSWFGDCVSNGDDKRQDYFRKAGAAGGAGENPAAVIGHYHSRVQKQLWERGGPGYPRRRATRGNRAAPMRAAPGMVRTQAQTMRRVTPQRTAERRRVAPTPTMAPVMVWVVLTGMPKTAFAMIVSPPAVSAANPPNGVSLVMRWPMVLMMRQPPAIVPPAMARQQQTITQSGTANDFSRPPETSAVVISPMPFCESFVPWPRLKSAAESNCKRRNQRSTF